MNRFIGLNDIQKGNTRQGERADAFHGLAASYQYGEKNIVVIAEDLDTLQQFCEASWGNFNHNQASAVAVFGRKSVVLDEDFKN